MQETTEHTAAEIPPWQFGLRLLWIAAQTYTVLCVGQQGVLFFYQAF